LVTMSYYNPPHRRERSRSRERDQAPSYGMSTQQINNLPGNFPTFTPNVSLNSFYHLFVIEFHWSFLLV
jgi:hypothetical protein